MSYFNNPSEIYLAIALALVLIAWRMYRYIQSTYRHIEDETLEDFWRNRLTDSKEVARVKDHLTHCDTCRDRLADIRAEVRKRPDVQRLIKRRF